MTDTELLREFVRSGAQEAFAEIVRRHVDLVYAAARRQANGDAELAEEITQRVFILLSQKAARLGEDVILGGWLFNSVRFVARGEMRRARRRSKHERKAAAMAEENRKAKDSGKPAMWDEAESVLDEAMGKLDQQARGILVLRYFEGKTAREVGDRLGISEEAARKRTSRAIEQLRVMFARSGVMLSASEIAQGLALPVMQAPAHVATSATLAATSSAAAAKATASGSFLKGAIGIMAYVKTQTAVLVIVSLILLGGAAVGVVEVVRSYNPTEEVVDLTPKKTAITGPTISGVVRGADGHPVAGATVIVATEKSMIFVAAHWPGGSRGQQPPNSQTSDANGKYTVAKPEPPYAIFAVTNTGIAQASWKQIESGSDLMLQPWSRIEGIVKVGNQPLPNARVSLWRVQLEGDPWMTLMHVEDNTRADANGHYIFPRVPPGEVWLSRYVNQNGMSRTQWKYVQVEPGATATVQIGGVGDRIIGHIIVPTDLAKVVDWTNKPPNSTTASIYRLDISREGPKHDPSETPEQYTAKELQFGQTEIGKAINNACFGSEFAINPDGTFAIDDVVPGTYQITIRSLKDLPAAHFMEDVARGEAKVTVPVADPIIGPPTNSAAAAPITVEVGAITMKAVPHRAEPGQPAPDFTTTTLDGKTWKLSDQRGKVVVLFFWPTYRLNQGEDQFAVFADKWGANPNVSILGLCLTDESDEKKQIESAAAKMKFHFPEAAKGELLLGPFDSSFPDAVLIDKSGKIVQKYLSGDSLEKAMEAAMGK